MSKQRKWNRSRSAAQPHRTTHRFRRQAAWWRRPWLWAIGAAVLFLLAFLVLRSQRPVADAQPPGEPQITQTTQAQPTEQAGVSPTQARQSPTAAPPTQTAAPGQIAGLQRFHDLSTTHVQERVTYEQLPPVGGEHSPQWLACGIYDQPVPEENAVHSMEHGAIWITYLPDLPPEDVERLRELVRGHTAVILSPYPNLPAPVVASGWSIQLRLDGSDDPRLPQFIEQYEQGPQTPERGASCSGGIGQPIER